METVLNVIFLEARIFELEKQRDKESSFHPAYYNLDIAKLHHQIKDLTSELEPYGFIQKMIAISRE